jgi:hypothetical protein
MCEQGADMTDLHLCEKGLSSYNDHHVLEGGLPDHYLYVKRALRP